MTLRKLLLVTTLTFFGGLLGLLGAAYWFRESLTRTGFNNFLVERQITLTSLQGLHFSSTHVVVEELELLLEPSGLRLAISDLDVGFSFITLSTVPVVDSLAVGSARLLREGEASSPAEAEYLLLSEVLQLFREFPVARVLVRKLSLPLWSETLALDMQHSAGELNLSIASGALQLEASFAQADAAAPALLQATLSRSEEAVATVEFSLQPEASAFHVAAIGHLPSGDLNALLMDLQQEPLTLPFTATSFDVEFAGRVADDLLGAITTAIAAGTGLDGEYRIHTEGLEISGLPARTPAFDVDANLVLSQNTLTFNTPLLLRNMPPDPGITTEGTYDLATGAVNLRASLPPVEFMEAGRPLSGWVSDWSYPFDLLTGSLAAEIELQWQAEVLTAKLTGTLKEVGGFYGDYFFRGMNGALQTNLDNAETFTIATPPLALTIAGIDVGVPLDNLALNFRYDGVSQQLLINSFYGEALGGTVTAADISYDFTRERNDILLQFSGLRLEDMLTLVEYEGVEATGAVSGELPITLTANGVEVALGSLHADAPGGSIRYLDAATAVAGDNVGLNLMNQALGNYQFESLTSSIDYSPDGELLLTMQLQGHNPDMNNGQRINLTLNLSDNIPALLESLQAARAIEDFLEDQYQ